MSAGYVWIDNAIVGEGEAGTKVATFTVRRADGADAFDVVFATEDLLAQTADGDYLSSSGVLRFGAGVDIQTISVTIKGDTKFELDEIFRVGLSAATNGAILMRTEAYGVIAADEKTSAAGNVWIGNSSVIEGSNGTRNMTFVVERAGGSKAFSVQYRTDYGSATEGVDYVKKTGVLNFAAGETSKSITVEVKGDTVAESLEDFAVILSDATGGAVITGPLGNAGMGWGTILDDDAGGRGVVSISNGVSVAEGNAGTKVVTFTVTRSGGRGAFDVNYSTNSYSAQAGSDFVEKSGTLKFAAGVNSQTISVVVNGDTVPETDEFFGVSLWNATNGAVIRQGSSYATIVNDDGTSGAGSTRAGVLWIDDATITEGNDGTRLATFTISRSGGVLPFSVSYATEGGGGYSQFPDPETGIVTAAATAFQDYIPVSGVLQFAAGVMSRTVTVAVKGDTTAEAAESFLLRLSNPTNGATIMGTAMWGRDFGTGIILDDDGTIPSTAGRVRIDDVVVVEGNNGTRLATFNVTRSGGRGAFSIDYDTADYGASAVGGDYVATAGTLSFAAGVTSQSITVAVKGDTSAELDEAFAVALTNATNGAIVDKGIAYGRIIDDDIDGFAGVVSIGNPAVPSYGTLEGNTGSRTLSFTVTRTQGTAAFSVKYATVDGTATAADGDYVAASGVLTFASGVDTQTISVVVNGDTKAEADQAFSIRLSDPTNGVILGASSVSLTILNDEPTILVDTGARLGAMTAAQLAALPGQGIKQIDASDDKLILNAAQWAALLGSDPASILDDVRLTLADDVTLKDTGANLAKLSGSALSALQNNVDRIDVSDNAVTLSMLQALNLRVPLSAGDVVTVRDTGQAIAAWPAASFSDLAARFVGSFDASDDALLLRVDQYRALGKWTLTKTDTVTLEDTESALAALTPAELAGLSAKGVDRISSTSTNLTLTTATYKALGTVGAAPANLVVLADTGAALAGLSASILAGMAAQGIDRLDATDDKLSLTAAQYKALGSVQLTVLDDVSLTDVGGRIAELTAAEIALLATAGVERIDATNDALALSYAQYAALGTTALTAADNVILKDTGATLAALSSATLAGLANVDQIDVTNGTLALTVAQATGLRVPLAAKDVLMVSDTGKAVGGLSASALADLATRFEGSFDTTDNVLALRVDQFRALGRRTLTQADTVTLQDTGTALSALTPTEIAGLATKGIDRISSTSTGNLVLTVAQYKALGSVTLNPANLVVLTDTGAALAALPAATFAELAGKGIDQLDATDGKLSLTVAQYKALGGVKLPAADVVTLADTGARIAALTPAEIALLAAAGIDRIDATDDKLVLSSSQVSSLGTVALTPADAVTLKDTGAVLAGLSSTVLGTYATKGVDTLDSSDNTLALTYAQFSALGTMTVSAGDALSVTGTSAGESFTFGKRLLAATDRIAGAGGTDTLVLDGDHAGLVLQPATLASIEQLVLKGSHSYDLRTDDANVAAGQTLAVNASALGALDTLIFDGSAETNGRFTFTGGAGSSTVTGGKGSDLFTGGSGRETIRYTAASQSTGTTYDTAASFNAAVDRFDLWTSVTAVDAPVTQGKLQSTAFDAGIANAMLGLAAYHAALFTPSTGNMAGTTFVVIDTNGTAGYQSGADLVVKLETPTNLTSLGKSSFV